MSEYRFDFLYDHWVIIAPQRDERPDEFPECDWRRSLGRCPFCAGHEQDTPPELARYQLPDRPGWQVRVVPNKYPAVVPAGSPLGAARPEQSLPGYGWHEVIIESPQHLTSLSQLDGASLELVLQAYQERLAKLRDRKDLAYAVIFKNVGPAAGASIEHTHSQLLATTLLPPPLETRHIRWHEIYAETGHTAVARWLYEEERQAVRCVASTEDFVAACPFASRVPFEVRLAPRHPSPYFERISDGQRRQLAQLFRDICRRLERAVPGVAYNVIVHTAPLRNFPHDYFHWYIEFLPRLTRAAGFEWGTGCFINPLEPERAASLLVQAENSVPEIR